VSRLSKLHQFTTREDWGTKDEGPRVHKARHKEVSDLWNAQKFEVNSNPFTPGELATALSQL